jgi:FKBP-type peptidyl-prolyl cis-trans isomerase FkpA
MQKGAKIRVYVPSSLGYGSSGKPPKIKPNEHLMFEIELVDIKDKMPQQPMNNMPQIQVQPKN